jgi:hypothetical protein
MTAQGHGGQSGVCGWGATVQGWAHRLVGLRVHTCRRSCTHAAQPPPPPSSRSHEPQTNAVVPYRQRLPSNELSTCTPEGDAVFWNSEYACMDHLGETAPSQDTHGHTHKANGSHTHRCAQRTHAGHPHPHWHKGTTHIKLPIQKKTQSGAQYANQTTLPIRTIRNNTSKHEKHGKHEKHEKTRKKTRKKTRTSTNTMCTIQTTRTIQTILDTNKANTKH